MKTAPDGRRIFIWHGRDPAEDTNRLTAAVAETCAAEIFELNGSLVWFHEGQLVSVSRPILLEIITKRIGGVRLVNHGTTDKPIYETEYFSFGFPPGADTSKEPDEKVLLSLMNGLKLLIAKGPSAPFKLTLRQQEEVHARLKMGEPQARIADAYHVDVGTIRQLARQG